MSAKQLLRLGLVFLGLMLLWGVAAIGRHRGSAPDSGDRLRLPFVARSAVDTVVLARAADTVVLARRDSTTWTANGFPASATTISDLLGALEDTTAGSELVAEQRASYAELGVDSAGGTRMRVGSRAKTLLELIAGHRSADFSGGYARLPDQERTYLVHGRLVETATRPADDWRDHRIAEVRGDSVGSIEVSRGPKRYTLRRTGTTWTLPTGTADSNRVAGFLSAYRRVEAAGFATPAQTDSARFNPPDRRVRLLRRDGTPLLTLMFDSTAGGMWVRSDTGKIVYRVDAYIADQLAPADSTLRPPPPPKKKR
jgi:uncharacterized protein DUF4340